MITLWSLTFAAEISIIGISAAFFYIDLSQQSKKTEHGSDGVEHE